MSAEREKLLKKLIETEMDGQEAVRQASTLKVWHVGRGASFD